MTDAFQCDGCDEYYHQDHRLVGVEVDLDWIAGLGITLDDLPAEMYELADVSRPSQSGGDYCIECGQQILQTLVGLFAGDGND